MMYVLLGISAVVVAMPMMAALIVTIASRREDARWSLGGPARSSLEAAARRIVAFDADSIEWPRSKAQAQAAAARREPAMLLPGHPERLLPDRSVTQPPTAGRAESTLPIG